MNESGLYCAISKVFSIEVLWSITCSMSCVTCYWQLNQFLLWLSVLLLSKAISLWLTCSSLACSSSSSSLEILTHMIEMWIFLKISLLYSRSQGINIKEWIFSVSNWYCLRPVIWFETLVTHCWHVHINVSVLYLKTLESIIIIMMIWKIIIITLHLWNRKLGYDLWYLQVHAHLLFFWN